MRLIEINQTGGLPAEIVLGDFLQEVIEATVPHYRRIGFVPPWVSYVGVENGLPLGVCGFKSQPVGGRVEIAYGTAPGHEGKGVGTALANKLVQIALREDESLAVFAQTLPEENASTSILQKLGFINIGSVEHPEDGTVWEWELTRKRISVEPDR